MEEMTAIEIARRFAEMGQATDACRAYAIVANDSVAAPEERMEAALYILQAEDNYRISYLCFLDLYVHGFYREDILAILTEAFYEPNEQELKDRYLANCVALKKYPYLFRKDFPEFDLLPMRFFPYDDGKYFPYYNGEMRFGDLTQPNDPAVRHYFFRDLQKPILAEDIFSQYELEYLNDNVRPSEWVGRENHIYLHYSHWEVFCSWLQVLDLRPLLKEKKLVFLIENELNLYPIDFKQRFHIDYGKYPVKPVGIREINRLIWHAQLSTHNGGDFFNEVFDAHPNLIAKTSLMLSHIEKYIDAVESLLSSCKNLETAQKSLSGWNDPRLVRELYQMRNRSRKDILVAIFLGESLGETEWWKLADLRSRIVPAIFFQPHFPNIGTSVRMDEVGGTDYALAEMGSIKDIHSSEIFDGFKYIKTFTPMRRFTVSYAASVRFAYNVADYNDAWEDPSAMTFDDLRMGDPPTEWVLNRSYMVDPEDRLFHDSVIVRFEDGKLNPKATFTALAEFLDLPYTESMTYCSEFGKKDPEHGTNAVGFDPQTVYRTYDDFVGANDRYYLEYFLREAYACFGYDFRYYDGAPMDDARLDDLISDFNKVDGWIRKIQERYWKKIILAGDNRELTPQEATDLQKRLDQRMELIRADRKRISHLILRKMKYVNRNGQPLRMAPKLQLDPALLETELYH